MRADDRIQYRYLDVDNKKLYKDQLEYKEALRDRKGKAVERYIPNYDHGQVLYAAGIKRNAFGESFSETEAVLLCRRLSQADEC